MTARSAFRNAAPEFVNCADFASRVFAPEWSIVTRTAVIDSAPERSILTVVALMSPASAREARYSDRECRPFCAGVLPEAGQRNAVAATLGMLDDRVALPGRGQPTTRPDVVAEERLVGPDDRRILVRGRVDLQTGPGVPDPRPA